MVVMSLSENEVEVAVNGAKVDSKGVLEGKDVTWSSENKNYFAV